MPVYAPITLPIVCHARARASLPSLVSARASTCWDPARVGFTLHAWRWSHASHALEGQELLRVLVRPGMRVPGRGRHVGVPEAIPDQMDRCPPVECVRCMGVPEPVR